MTANDTALAKDFRGQSWFVRSSIETAVGFPIFFGKRVGRIDLRGRAAVIPSIELIQHLRRHRDALRSTGLPLSQAAVYQLVRRYLDDPLQGNRQPKVHRRRRPRGWWRAPICAALILRDDLPQRVVASRLNISQAEVSGYRRLLALERGAKVVPRKPRIV